MGVRLWVVVVVNGSRTCSIVRLRIYAVPVNWYVVSGKLAVVAMDSCRCRLVSGGWEQRSKLVYYEVQLPRISPHPRFPGATSRRLELRYRRDE
jgi:hypothetical protein